MHIFIYCNISKFYYFLSFSLSCKIFDANDFEFWLGISGQISTQCKEGF